MLAQQNLFDIILHKYLISGIIVVYKQIGRVDGIQKAAI